MSQPLDPPVHDVDHLQRELKAALNRVDHVLIYLREARCVQNLPYEADGHLRLAIAGASRASQSLTEAHRLAGLGAPVNPISCGEPPAPRTNHSPEDDGYEPPKSGDLFGRPITPYP